MAKAKVEQLQVGTYANGIVLIDGVEFPVDFQSMNLKLLPTDTKETEYYFNRANCTGEAVFFKAASDMMVRGEDDFVFYIVIAHEEGHMVTKLYDQYSFMYYAMRDGIPARTNMSKEPIIRQTFRCTKENLTASNKQLSECIESVIQGIALKYGNPAVV